MEGYEFKWIRGEHVAVYFNGVFQFSADSMQEAYQELSKAGGGEV